MIIVNKPDAFVLSRHVIISLVGFVFEHEGFNLGRLVISFVSDEELLQMNRDFLQHDYYTDVISFGGITDNWINGELYISYNRACDNSKIHGVSYENELLRLIIHGALHLAGWLDSTANQRTLMTEREDYYLSLNVRSST